LIWEVIKENHDPVFVAHPGVKRTQGLILLRYWWPGMHRSVEEYIQKCDPSQKRKEDREFRTSLAEVEMPTTLSEVTSMDIIGPYPVMPRGNKYLLTFIDHFTKYVEAYPLKDQTAESCARIYATQIVTRHDSGSKLITDQGRAFMSSFFQETCKILGIRTSRTSSYHPQSNRQIKRFHRSLHTGLSNYINMNHNNWDNLVYFYLMAYCATPNIVTGYSPYYLLHGRKMTLPNSDNLKAKISSEDPDQNSRLKNLQSSLKLAYQQVARANKKSYLKNKFWYDCKAKQRKFEVNDFVYLYNPAMKPGLSRKFRKP
jgi:transposase InsO family protein